MNTEAEARARGNAMLAAMGDAGAGWAVVVWANLGWWVRIVSPCTRLKVIPTTGVPADSYVAYLSEPATAGGRWTGIGATPQEAIARAVEAGRAELAEVQAILAGL